MFLIQELFKNKDYVIMLICTGGGIALYAVVHALLEQFLCPFGYTDVSIRSILTTDKHPEK